MRQSPASMRPRLSTALLAGRAAAALSRRTGRGGGTVIAGHLVPRIEPHALRLVTERLPLGSVVVSGTNGKTTTTRLISHIVRRAGHSPLHNREGANLLTGLYSAVAQHTDWQGRPQADVGIFEVDEATLPSALEHVRPRVLLLHNIFRDQLDRYGEVHFVADLWRKAVAGLSGGTRLVLNADDPLVAGLADAATGAEVVTFGVDDEQAGTTVLPHAADARLCPRCSGALRYDLVFYGHLGWYACTRCEFRRPTPTISVSRVIPRGDAGSDVALVLPGGQLAAHLALPGLYNVYNALAATAVADALGVAPGVIQRGLETFTAAFGRLERVEVEGRHVFLTLVKNPVGFTEVLRTVTDGTAQRTLMLAINDRFADGTDVSWLWDVEFERLLGRVSTAVCSGIRAEDMAVRLKYAGVEPARIRVENDLRRALDLTVEAAEPGETVYVLPTYTAMLGVRDVLRQTGYIKGFWED